MVSPERVASKRLVDPGKHQETPVVSAFYKPEWFEVPHWNIVLLSEAMPPDE